MTIREASAEECAALGQLMVDVYSDLEGFPGIDEQPGYYQMLANIGKLAESPDTKILIAMSPDDELLGGVVYFGDMKDYGSGGTATQVTNASGIRLLAVKPDARGKGIGRDLTIACIQLAKEKGHREVVLHTTDSMRVAWRMYEKMGFERSMDLDFSQQGLPVFGFRLSI